MNFLKPLAVAILLAAAGAGAHAGQVPAVDHAYRITGDAQAAPVQAFRVGSDLYLQLRNVKAPPAPFATNGQPIPYQNYGPYIVVPTYSRVVLHYGNATAYVTAADAGLPSPAQGGASVTTPVDATRPQPRITAPVQGPAPLVVPSAAVASSGSTVSGSITGANSAATQGAPGATSVTTTATASGNAPVTIPITDAASTLVRVPVTPGGAVLITADGTVSGARAAESVKQRCADKGLSCRIDYTGAPAGSLTVAMESAP